MIRDARLFVRGEVHEVHRRTLQSGILTSMSGDAGEYELRLARAEDGEFLIEMARLACTLDGRPVPSGDDPEVVGVLPVAGDAAIIAADTNGMRVGAAWWHIHEPPLVRDADGRPLPEMVMAVVEAQRRRGIGTSLVEALAQHAARRFSALTLNVHLHNPAVRLYTQTGFRVAGPGRGWFGVAMSRPLDGQ